MNILDKIIDHKIQEVVLQKSSFPLEELERGIKFKQEGVEAIKFEKRDFHSSLKKENSINIIAEVKKASPSKGLILSDFQPLKIASEYQEGGASAISILTDENFFQGKLDYLPSIRTTTSIPLLRKDFIVDEYQVFQSKFYEADAILLIGRILSLSKLKDLFQLSTELDLDVLYEIHDREDLYKGVELGIDIFGINNRNLQDFSVNTSNIIELLEEIPSGKILVSESGISCSDDIARLKCFGITNFLIGESLMKSEDRVAFLKSLLSA